MKRIVWKHGDWINPPKKYLQFVKNTNQKRLMFLSNEDWEDIESDILLHIWKKKSLYNKKMSYFCWIKKVVKNQLENQIRNRRTALKKNKLDSLETLLDKSHRDSYSFDYTELSSEFGNVLNNTEKRVWAHRQNGHSGAEISKILDMDYQYSASTLTKIRKKYKDFLNGQK